METTVIKSFTGPYEFLSNYYVCDQPFVYNNLNWYNAEAAFQAEKYDGKNKDIILRAFTKLTPDEAKKMGRAMIVRDYWCTLKYKIMEDILRCKFKQIDDLGNRLLDTGDAILIEGNTWHDNIWGSCTCSSCEDRGWNHLGQILMQIRDELRQVKQRSK